MDIGQVLFIAFFVLVVGIDLYLDSMYRGVGAWLLSHSPLRPSPSSTGFRIAAPLAGFAAVVAGALCIWGIVYAYRQCTAV